MMNYTFKLPTDHFQFYVQDRQSRPDTSMIWDEITELNRIAVEPGLRARLGTIRLPPFVEFSDADTACFVRHGDAVSGASVAWN